MSADPASPSPVVGVLGAGQLGLMLGQAGAAMGVGVRFYDPVPDACAAAAGPVMQAGWDDAAALARFAEGLAVATWEFENVPVAAPRALAHHVGVAPPVGALEVAQDRLPEKECFRALGIPTPVFHALSIDGDVALAAESVGFPAILKTRRLGYDGKGQAVVREARELAAAWQRLGRVPSILEQFVPFDGEVSLLAARSSTGETTFYPLVENRHAGGILRVSRAPARSAWRGTLQELAEAHGRRVLERLGYVGVLAIEFFVVGDQLVANEMAPRVHNSGHWTIEGSATSQFENHLRAVLGWPLGSTAMRAGHAVMLNLIGALPPGLDGWRQLPGVAVHLYGKEPRPGRKIGHVTITGDDTSAVEALATTLLAAIEAATPEDLVVPGTRRLR